MRLQVTEEASLATKVFFIFFEKIDIFQISFDSSLTLRFQVVGKVDRGSLEMVVVLEWGMLKSRLLRRLRWRGMSVSLMGQVEEKSE